MDINYPMYCRLINMHLELKELSETRPGLRKAMENIESKFSSETGRLIKMMEEMANGPREEYGKREPGELGSLERSYNMGGEVHEGLRKET